ncbi:MAG TPA: xanthine dehydrogenase family protein molybdopterin-binding subunit [Nitrososphaerales archaeon]|nr:xanthine dehydrogenase family protein molybdopterin-binding subunit [Nitrososphaerales archaeon]
MSSTIVRGEIAVEEERMVGKNIRPRKDLQLLKGEGTYTDDLKLPKMLYAAFLRSPYAHAKIRNIDVSKAYELPGVVYVLTGRETAKQLVSWMALPGLRTPERLSLATDKVRFVGEPVVAVAAVSRAIAEDALELIEVDYDPLEPVTDAEQSIKDGSPLLYEDWGDNILFHDVFHGGETDEAFKQADIVLKERLVSNRYSPTPMENRAILASYNSAEKTLLVYASTQFPHALRTFLAQTLDFPEHKIRVIAPRVGGGFGIKSAVFQDEVSTVLLSMKLGRPVKWYEDRKEHLLVAGHERQQVHYVECAVKKDGTLLGVRDKIVADFGVSGTFWTEVQPAMLTCASLPGPYRLKNYDFDLLCVVTNKAPCGPHRGFGRPVAAFVIERMMDLIAKRLGMMPEEIRLKNMIDTKEMPWKTPIGVLYDTGNYKQVLERALKFAQLDKLREEQRKLRNQGRFIGIGLATYVEYTAPASSRLQGPLGWAVGGWESCRLSVDPSGKVTAHLGMAGQGQPHETVFAQVISDALGADFEDIAVLEGDTQESPYGFGAWASRGTVTSGGACIKASRKLKDKILLIAGHLLKQAPEDLEIKNSIITVKSDPSKRISLKEVADVAIRFSGKLPQGMEPGLEVVSFYEPDAPTTCSYATHLVSVEVDPETGYVKLLKYYIVDDSGVLINPMTAHGQVHGALAHGIGGAMFEDLVYDKEGQLLSSTFMDYLLPTANEMPTVEVDSIETPSLTLGGFKGLGEGAAIPTAGAIANAVDDALSQFGIKYVDLPITPEKVRTLLVKAGGRRPTSS